MLPASFGYLSALAASTQVNGSWAAAAGVARGGVPGLVGLCQNVTNAIAESYNNRDSISINPITNVKPYGLLIWGNRTLKNNAKKGDLTATSFLSIRQLTNDVKRTVWVAAKMLTFEQNNDILWINFKSKIIPTLDQMVSGGGLSGYEIKKQKTDKKATIKAKIVLYAIEPVEDWDITIELADQSTEISG
jgi:phage tail sheath protein FI